MESSVEHLGTFGSDLLVVNAARISYDRWHETFDEFSDSRLIQKLAKEKHFSPFYHPVTTLRVTAPIYVARQLHRHHIGLAMNEVSRRYTSANIEFEESDNEQIAYAYRFALYAYNNLLDAGVHREKARAVLPLGLMTTWLWSGSLYAYHNLCKQRLADDAQHETRFVAEQISDIMLEQYPVSWPMLRQYDS